MNTNDSRLAKQIEFIVEIDKSKPMKEPLVATNKFLSFVLRHRGEDAARRPVLPLEVTRACTAPTDIPSAVKR